MKKCPYCAEEIQDDAIVCRYCQRDLAKSLPKPVQKNKIITIIGWIVVLCLACVGFSIVWDLFISPILTASSPANKPYATLTRTPYQTNTPRPSLLSPIRTSTPYQSPYLPEDQGCLSWDQVTSKHIGQTICVFGYAYRNKSIAGTTTQITFTDDPNVFFLASGTVYYPDVSKGDCVMAQGPVLENTYHTPYIDIDNGLKNCN